MREQIDPVVRRFLGAALAACFAATICEAFADGIPLGTHTVVSFASVRDGEALLTSRDEFVAALTPLDRSARMKTDRDITEQEFLAAAGASVEQWTAEETNRIAQVLQSIGARFAPWHLPFPATILLVKTSGREEFNFSYTRQNAVMLPEAELKTPSLEPLLIHEFFHVLSRANPDLRARLYGVIGFSRINEIDFGGEFRGHLVTNPDGVQNGWMIAVTNRSKLCPAVPILHSDDSRFDPNGSSPVERYFRLAVVENSGGRWVPKLESGRPQLLKVSEVTGFYEQVGRNTGYIIHPDEILADNFVMLIRGRTNVASPEILTGMKRALSAAGP